MRVRPWAVLVVLLLVAVGILIAWRNKAEVRVTAGAITFDIDPVNGDVGVSADPLLFVSKFVKIEVGAGIEPEDGEQLVVIRTAQDTNWAATIPAEGSWSVDAHNVVGHVTVSGDVGRRRTVVDLRRAYVESLELERSEGSEGWDREPEITKLQTHTVVVDTSLLDTGDFTYCDGNCAIYLHSVPKFADSTRIISDKGDPVIILNGTSLDAICEAGGEAVYNDLRQSSEIWEYVQYEGRVGYVPALWTGTAFAPVVRVCGT
jgi:hypothetical protein